MASPAQLPQAERATRRNPFVRARQARLQEASMSPLNSSLNSSPVARQAAPRLDSPMSTNASIRSGATSPVKSAPAAVSDWVPKPSEPSPVSLPKDSPITPRTPSNIQADSLTNVPLLTSGSVSSVSGSLGSVSGSRRIPAPSGPRPLSLSQRTSQSPVTKPEFDSDVKNKIPLEQVDTSRQFELSKPPEPIRMDPKAGLASKGNTATSGPLPLEPKQPSPVDQPARTSPEKPTSAPVIGGTTWAPSRSRLSLSLSGPRKMPVTAAITRSSTVTGTGIEDVRESPRGPRLPFNNRFNSIGPGRGRSSPLAEEPAQTVALPETAIEKSASASPVSPEKPPSPQDLVAPSATKPLGPRAIPSVKPSVAEPADLPSADTQPREAPAEQTRRLNGIEVRSDELRAATSKKFSDRSERLPQPTFVSNQFGRPIVSFNRDWKPTEDNKEKDSGQSQTPGLYNRGSLRDSLRSGNWRSHWTPRTTQIERNVTAQPAVKSAKTVEAQEEALSPSISSNVVSLSITQDSAGNAMAEAAKGPLARLTKQIPHRSSDPSLSTLALRMRGGSLRGGNTAHEDHISAAAEPLQSEHSFPAAPVDSPPGSHAAEFDIPAEAAADTDGPRSILRQTKSVPDMDFRPRSILATRSPAKRRSKSKSVSFRLPDVESDPEPEVRHEFEVEEYDDSWDANVGHGGYSSNDYSHPDQYSRSNDFSQPRRSLPDVPPPEEPEPPVRSVPVPNISAPISSPRPDPIRSDYRNAGPSYHNQGSSPLSMSNPIPTINVGNSIPSISVGNSAPSVSGNGSSHSPIPIPAINVGSSSNLSPVPAINVPDQNAPVPPARSRDGWSLASAPRPIAQANSTSSSSIVCNRCRLSISGRIVSAGGARFHPDCFLCSHCGEHLECVAFYPEPESERTTRIANLRNAQLLAGESATEDDEILFYCHLDYHEKYSPRCKSCQTPIEGEVVLACGAEYHVGHFFCAQCGDPFDSTTPFVEKDGYAWCVGCHTNRFSSKCRRCRKPITDTVIRALGGEWHGNCFCCSLCSNTFPDGQFFLTPDGKDPVCVPCEKRRLKA